MTCHYPLFYPLTHPNPRRSPSAGSDHAPSHPHGAPPPSPPPSVSLPRCSPAPEPPRAANHHAAKPSPFLRATPRIGQPRADRPALTQDHHRPLRECATSLQPTSAICVAAGSLRCGTVREPGVDLWRKLNVTTARSQTCGVAVLGGSRSGGLFLSVKEARQNRPTSWHWRTPYRIRLKIVEGVGVALTVAQKAAEEAENLYSVASEMERLFFRRGSGLGGIRCGRPSPFGRSGGDL